MKDKEKTKEQLINELEGLLEKNEFFLLLTESMPFAVYTSKVGGDFGATYISENITELTGYKPENFTSSLSFWIDNVHPDDKQMLDDNLSNLLEKGIIKYYYRWRVADGSYRWFYDISKLIKLKKGQADYIIGTWVDITELKQVEKALRESEAKYEDLYDNAPDMLVSVDAKTAKVIQCNQTLATALDYGKEEITGQPIFNLYHPDCMEDVKKAFKSFVETGEAHNDKLQLKRKDGSKIDVILNVSAVSDGQGNILYSRSSWRDITEKKKAEKELRQRVEELEQFYQMAIGREIKMKELKDEIEKLRLELKEYRK